jgi:hypothetical protein
LVGQFVQVLEVDDGLVEEVPRVLELLHQFQGEC